MFSHSIVILVAMALANPVARAVSATCYFVATPTPDLGVDGLQSSINYAIGHTVAIEYEGKSLTTNNSLVRHNDGTYDVYSTITVTDVDSAEVGTFVESWYHTTLEGFDASWFINAVNCY